MKSLSKIDLLVTLILVILGQLIFLIVSPKFLEVSHVNQIFSTIGVQDKQENLQTLSEAANQFGQTLSGWMKFPNFMNDLSKAVPLPAGSSIEAYMQERQNLIITLNTPSTIPSDALMKVKDFVQAKINAYNEVSQTKFILTQVDFAQTDQQKTYTFGAGVTLIITLILAMGIAFLRRELK